MSRRRTASIAAGLVTLLLATAAPASAQSTHRAEEAVLARHLDSIVPLFLQARHDMTRGNARAAAARKAAEASTEQAPAVTVDTVRVGPLRILTTPAQARTAKSLFGDVWHEYQPWLDDSPALDRTLFTFQWTVGAPAPIPATGQVALVEARRWEPRALVESRIRDQIGFTLGHDLDSARVLQGWFREAVRSEPDPSNIYRDLAATPSKLNRSCLRGDVHACAEALRLETDGSDWRTWYTPEERRQLVLYDFAYNRREPKLDACRAGSDKACDEILSQAFGRELQLRIRISGTLAVYARRSLLWFALQQGGKGAWGRLLQKGNASADEALAAASGLPVDRLVAAWRRWVVTGRPHVATTVAGGTALAGVWILLFAALAVRSTRWRLG